MPRLTLTSFLALLLLPVLALGFSACATDRPVEHTEAASHGPTVYGRISVSVDHVSTR